MKKYLNSYWAILILILLIGLILRVYKLEIFYPWGHDQDLFAWIAKDILVNHHLRLIGQETSVGGIFIGPIFYYLIAASFALFNMNPLSANIVTTVVSLFTIFSIYFCFSKFFNKRVGLAGAFIYAVSPGVVFLDRWVVPTQPTILWSVWYLYVLFSVLKGNFQILIPLSLLVGLIWHIHIAFIPLLILLPLAVFLSRKQLGKVKYSFRTLIASFIILITLLAPFVLFETRHGFQQTKSLLNATQQEHRSIVGLSRVEKVFDASGKSLSGVFILNNPALNLSTSVASTIPVILFLLILFLSYKKLLDRNKTIILISWFAIDLVSQFLSKRSISEYYLNNLFIILFLSLALFLVYLSARRKIILVILMGLYLAAVSYWFITSPDASDGYLEKRKAIEYIKSDAFSKAYPCIAINYIEEKGNVANGFRYLFWLNKLHVISGGNDVPVYNIVTPWTISGNEIDAKFGMFGVILPSQKDIDPSVCKNPGRQLLPPLGFTS